MDIIYNDTLVVGHTIATGKLSAVDFITDPNEIIFGIVDGLRQEMSPLGMWQQTTQSKMGLYIIERLDVANLAGAFGGDVSYKYAVAPCVDSNWAIEDMAVKSEDGSTHVYDKVNMAATWGKDYVRYSIYRINLNDPSDTDYTPIDGYILLTPANIDLIVQTYNDVDY